MKNILALLAVLLWAGLVQAAGFEDCTSGTAKGSITAGKSLCVDFVNPDLDSNILSVGKCKGGFTVVYNADVTGTGLTMTLQVMTCVNPIADTDNCNPIDGVTLDGDPTGNLADLYGASAQWIYLNGATDPGSDEPRVLVLCHG